MFSKIGIVRMIPLILEQLDEKYMTYSECIFGSFKEDHRIGGPIRSTFLWPFCLLKKNHTLTLN